MHLVTELAGNHLALLPYCMGTLQPVLLHQGNTPTNFQDTGGRFRATAGAQKGGLPKNYLNLETS